MFNKFYSRHILFVSNFTVKFATVLLFLITSSKKAH